MDFVRIADFNQIPARLKGGVVAIGNFDGVHYGHRAVLDRALKLANDENLPALVLTFEPHPRTVFKPDAPVYRLTPAPMKAGILKALGFNGVVEQTFSREFASHSAEDFVRDVLVGGFAVKNVVTGFDFHFGKGREGGPAFLTEAGLRHGFGVALTDAIRDEGSEVVSSSRIRASLNDGNLQGAAQLLGYRFRVTAEVVHGKKLG
ncbi:MAG: adenylyltransferase/cytidyltransferase family protein, partial [Notoacmeibacter sp.]